MKKTRSNRSPSAADVVHGQLAVLDVESLDFGGEARLRQVVLVEIDAEDARRAAPLHLHGMKPGIAADIEHGHAR